MHTVFIIDAPSGATLVTWYICTRTLSHEMENDHVAPANAVLKEVN